MGTPSKREVLQQLLLALTPLSEAPVDWGRYGGMDDEEVVQLPIRLGDVRFACAAVVAAQKWLATMPPLQVCSVSGCTRAALDQGRGPSVCRQHDPGR